MDNCNEKNDANEELPQMTKAKTDPTSNRPGQDALAEKKIQRQKTVVGEDVKNAWMARGWSLSRAIGKHGCADMQEMNKDMKLGDARDGMTQDALLKRQLRLDMLIEVNKQLQTTLVNKKLKEEDLRHKIDALMERLSAAFGVEKGAREMAEAALEERILTEEKEKQDMQLALSQDMRMREENIAEVQATNKALVMEAAQNKKLMKEQQVQIKERQKANRHLGRQIQVLEAGARKSAQENVDDEQTIISREQTMFIERADRSSSLDDGDDGMLQIQREKTSAIGDSKGLLRGAAAEKHLEAEKRRIKAHRQQTHELSSQNAARSMAEIKALPGLDLNKLLGIAPQPAPPVEEGCESATGSSATDLM